MLSPCAAGAEIGWLGCDSPAAGRFLTTKVAKVAKVAGSRTGTLDPKSWQPWRTFWQPWKWGGREGHWGGQKYDALWCPAFPL